MDTNMRTISNNTYHHALALYILARRKQVEVDKMEHELHDVLGLEIGSCLSDAIYIHENMGEQREFDLALGYENLKKEIV